MTNTRSPTMMGVDPLQAGRAVFQAMFLSSLHSMGRFLAELIPLLSGPRHWGQSADAEVAAIANRQTRVMNWFMG